MLEPFRSIAFWGSIPFALAVSWVGFRAARFLARRQGWPEPARRVERGFIAMLTTGIATAVYINHLGDDAGLIGRLAKGLDRLESTAYWLYGMPFALWAGLAVRQRWFAPPAGRELMKVSQPRRRGLLVLLSVTTCVTAWSITNDAPTSEQIVAGIGAIGLILSFVTGFGRPLRMTENGIQRPMLAVLRWDDIRSCRMEHCVSAPPGENCPFPRLRTGAAAAASPWPSGSSRAAPLPSPSSPPAPHRAGPCRSSRRTRHTCPRSP